MPGRDGTGPLGLGPLTGRGLGPCSLGLRRGFGRGFGWRYWQCVYPTRSIQLTEADEKKILEAELKDIEAERQQIEKRLKELSK